MKTLPVIPVETLATARTAAPNGGRNPGIVPPWMQGRPVGNGGFVPPWLQDDAPHHLGGAHATTFDPTPIQIDPNMPHIMGRR